MDLQSIKFWILLIVGGVVVVLYLGWSNSRDIRGSGMYKIAEQSGPGMQVAQDVVKEALIKEAKTSGKPQSREVGNLVLTAYPDGTTSSVAVAAGARSAPPQQGDWWSGIITLSYVLLGIVVIIFVVAPILQRILKNTPS